MTTMRGRRPGTLATLAAAAAVLAGCGGNAPVVDDEVPVSIAEPVPFEASGLSPRSTPSPILDAPPDAPPEPSPEPEPTPDPDATAEATDGPPPSGVGEGGPTSADAAAFVASDALAGLDGVEHVVVDLDGDTWPEVVATGVRDRVGVLRVAWWTSGGYQVLVADEAGAGRDVTDLRAADVNQDGRIELLVTVEGEGLQSMAVWGVPGRGSAERLEAVGGCHDGRHVYGVTIAKLQSSGDGPPAIVADCDESPLPVADWSEHRWEWQDGAYRHVPRSGPDPGAGAGDDEDTDPDDDAGESDGGEAGDDA